MLDKVKELVNAFLVEQDKECDVDETILEYVSQSLLDHDEDDDVIGDLEDLLVSVCPAFANRTSDERVPRLLELYQQVQQVRAQANSRTNTGLLRGHAAPCPVQPPDCTTADQERHTNKASSSEDSDSSDTAHDPAVDQLMELYPSGVSRDFLSHMLRKCGGIEGTVEWLLECEDVQGQEAAWLAAKQLQEEEQQQAHLVMQKKKQQILARFDLQVVPDATTKPKAGNKQIPLWTSDEKQKTVRYLNGQVVSSKGEKYIIEKIGDEWDGGSRGKVYTKGKRGKGFI